MGVIFISSLSAIIDTFFNIPFKASRTLAFFIARYILPGIPSDFEIAKNTQ